MSAILCSTTRVVPALLALLLPVSVTAFATTSPLHIRRGDLFPQVPVHPAVDGFNRAAVAATPVALGVAGNARGTSTWPNMSSIFGTYGENKTQEDTDSHIKKKKRSEPAKYEQQAKWAVNWTGPYRQELTNNLDVQYTARILVGGQNLSTVLDTGSFELLVFSKQCALYGGDGDLYSQDLSSTYTDLGFMGEHSFGSGTTKSNEAFEHVVVGPYTSKRQHFWEVVEADMTILDDGFFHAILGMGPPRSAMQFAQSDSDDVHKELKQFRETYDEEAPRDVLDEVQHYDEAVQHASNASSLTESLKMENISVCLGKQPMSKGFFIWGDNATSAEPSKFTELSVVGDTYWSLNLSNVGMSKTGSYGDMVDDMPTACHGDKRCSAVVDTGTSLIVAPSVFVQKVQESLDEWEDPMGDCSDLSSLPDLEFKLNGISFSLPPSSYVGKVTGDVDDKVTSMMPHLGGSSNKGQCVSLLVPGDTETQFGHLWILGMPFFRKYYTSFQFRYDDSTKLPITAGRADTISVALADADCRPASHPSAVSDGSSLRQQHTLKAPVEPFTIEPSKIQMPRFVHRATRTEAAAGSFRRTRLSEVPSKMPAFIHV